eukprot:235873-Pelagomonas_calceolata.AAC.1
MWGTCCSHRAVRSVVQAVRGAIHPCTIHTASGTVQCAAVRGGPCLALPGPCVGTCWRGVATGVQGRGLGLLPWLRCPRHGGA